MKTISIATMMAVTALSTLSSCSILQKVKGGEHHADRLVESKAAPKPACDLSLISGRWTVDSIDGKAVEQPDDDDDRAVTVTFELNNQGAGTIYCFTGCNYLNGDVTFSTKDDSVTPRGNYMSTMMACDPESMATESSLTQTLADMRRYSLTTTPAGHNLTLFDADGHTLAVLSRFDSRSLNGAWEVTSIGQRSVNPTDEVQLVIDLPMQRIHGKTGCNIINGSLRTSTERPGALEFTNLATTYRSCPDPDRNSLERELLVALESVAACNTDGETATLLDDNGNPLITLHRLILKR